MYDYNQLTEIFNKVIENPADAAAAVQDPSSILTKYGLNVPDPNATNEIFFQVAPQLRAHFTAAAAGKPHADALAMCTSPKCIACKAGIGAACAVAIGVALAGGPAAEAAIEEIAEFTGLSVNAVKNIITGIGGGVGSVIDELCSAMGAC